MAEELRPHNIAAVSLWPGLVRTERTIRVMEEQPEVDLSSRLGETVSPQFIGRAVVALATDSKIMERSGQVVIAAELAAERGFTDIDGKLPPS
jgi:dehydrogenase/reductase SDR family protein 1